MAKEMKLFKVENTVIKKVIPLGDVIITTSDKYDNDLAADSRGFVKDVKKAGAIRPIQKVVAISSMGEARGIKVGDSVLINFSRYGYSKQSKDSIRTAELSKEEYNATKEYSVPVMLIDGIECLKISIGDLEGIVEVEYTNK